MHLGGWGVRAGAKVTCEDREAGAAQPTCPASGP